MERTGIEPVTSGLQSRESGLNGRNRARTGSDANPHGYRDRGR
jgi:hypothetical protein